PVGNDRPVRAERERHVCPSRSGQTSIEMVNRGTVATRIFYIFATKIPGQRQPWLHGREARMHTRIPLHWRSFAVAPQTETRKVFFERVMDPVRRDRHLSHSNLVAIINGRGAAERQQQHRSNARLFTSDSASDTRAVVIAKYPIRPPSGW